jgi:hypothetical protein
MTNAFKKFMQETYSHNEMAEIAQHGCESGCACGMIYYYETIKLFDKYRDDLFSIMDDYSCETGIIGLPPYVQENSATFTSFANAVVWFCAEAVAYKKTQGEFIDDEAA